MGGEYRVILSKRVGGQLRAISDYIAARSPQGAASMVGRILDAIERLETLPHRTLVEGQRPGMKHPVRSLPVPPYVVFFRVIDPERVVRIVEVRHGARGRPRRFDP